MNKIIAINFGKPASSPPLPNQPDKNQEEAAQPPKYGDAKSNAGISLEEMVAHPIWLWCMSLDLPDEADGPMGGDETWMRPLLSSTDVTAKMGHPLILLRVKGT